MLNIYWRWVTMAKLHPFLKEQLPRRGMLHFADLVTITGDIVSAITLSQLCYWWDRRKGNSFYKTAQEFEQETGIKVGAQKRAINRLKAFGFLSVKYKQVPRRRHFILNEEKIISTIQSFRQNSTVQNDGIEVVTKTGTAPSKQPVLSDQNNSTITESIHIFNKHLNSSF